MPDISTTLSGIPLPNPVIPASGTFGFGYEMASWYDINVLGGIALKGTTQNARFGNPTPRIAECASGMLNAVGLQNPGVEAVIAEELPKLRRVYSGLAIANISGFGIEEYVYTAKKFDEDDTAAILEVNVSCPNVQHGGMAFGTSPGAAAAVTAAVKKEVKKPVYIKLSPNVTDIAEVALACEEAGADGLVLINTLLGMRIHPRTGKPIVSIGSCGFSGPAIKPVALRMVYDVCKVVNIPVIGVGGIATADDVLEFVSAGASAVQVGSQNLVDPFACPKIIEELPKVMQQYGITSLNSIKGRAHT
ncbi:dihydroorotate dehydrogenase [Ruminococcaceae bacterium OttesenSCG-928-A16]|nr:dihydroorotate dehydrogenase [Ruminococcaceae bacterium OttesenSCG-928-A16]